MKHKHTIAKTLFQIFLYLIELLSVSLFFTYLTSFLAPITSSISFLERMILAYTIYQILVIVILTNLNDIQKDSYLAWITTLKLILLYAETRDQKVKITLNRNLDYQLNSSTLNSSVFRNAYENLKHNLDTIDETSVKLELIIAEQQFEMQSLNWKFSFLLRSRFIK